MNAPVKYVGTPDGPPVFISEFGCEVPTFDVEPGGKRAALMHHVPLNMRGDYRPQELANYDPKFPYRTDTLGKVLCNADKLSGEKCNSRAVNRCGLCVFHGGRLHPLDKLVKDSQEGANEQEHQSLSRYKLFLAGQLTVDDLDDEELASCGFRSTNGRIYRPRNVPRELTQAFQKAIYERANRELRSLTVEAAQTMGEIMKNKNVEPDIRLKAALSILERNLGKTPQVVAFAEAKPYEEVFDAILPISRDESRAARGIESSSAAIESAANTIDAEVVEPESLGTERVENGNPVQDKDFGLHTPDNSKVSQRPNNVAGVDDSNESPNARLFERNPAIISPVVEIRPFEYDLSSNKDDIQKETRKRYARRALANTPDVPLTLIKTPLTNGHTHVLVDPKSFPKVKTESKSKAAQRKSYTLGDFS